MLPVENNFNKIGLPHVYIALFRCLWVPGGGLDPFRRILRSDGWLPLKKNTSLVLRTEKFSGVDKGLPKKCKKFRFAFLPTNKTFVVEIKPSCITLDVSYKFVCNFSARQFL